MILSYPQQDLVEHELKTRVLKLRRQLEAVIAPDREYDLMNQLLVAESQLEEAGC